MSDPVFLSQVFSVAVALIVITATPIYFLLRRIGMPRIWIALCTVPLVGMIVLLWLIAILPWPDKELTVERT